MLIVTTADKDDYDDVGDRVIKPGNNDTAISEDAS